MTQLKVADDFVLMFRDSETGKHQTVTLPTSMLGAIPNSGDMITVTLLDPKKEYKVKSITRTYDASGNHLVISAHVELS